MCRGCRLMLEQILEASTGPEAVLETVSLAIDLAQARPFLEHDGPHPHASREQTDHDDFHDDVGLHEEAPKRQVNAWRRQIRRIDSSIHLLPPILRRRGAHIAQNSPGRRNTARLSFPPPDA